MNFPIGSNCTVLQLKHLFILQLVFVASLKTKYFAFAQFIMFDLVSNASQELGTYTFTEFLLPVDSDGLCDDSSADWTPPQAELQIPSTVITCTGVSTRPNGTFHHLVHADFTFEIGHLAELVLGLCGSHTRSLGPCRHRHGPSSWRCSTRS